MVKGTEHHQLVILTTQFCRDIDEEKDGEEPPNDEGYYEEQARLKKESVNDI